MGGLGSAPRQLQSHHLIKVFPLCQGRQTCLSHHMKHCCGWAGSARHDTTYNPRLFNRKITGPVRNVSHCGLIVKCKISYGNVRGERFGPQKIQPGLRLGSKACKLLQDFDSKGLRCWEIRSYFKCSSWFLVHIPICMTTPVKLHKFTLSTLLCHIPD